ncbi:hypothetical protein E2C01_009690 [Portunus trituberculatus]|uniref:Uncharacterized protein n=1 Tax=Portunus trituberculatus TaxID=210409 RepID=A0A5B7D6E4_PORTR|nr:hypothetical protein [Portunus trituberculatus]
MSGCWGVGVAALDGVLWERYSTWMEEAVSEAVSADSLDKDDTQLWMRMTGKIVSMAEAEQKQDREMTAVREQGRVKHCPTHCPASVAIVQVSFARETERSLARNICITENGSTSGFGRETMTVFEFHECHSQSSISKPSLSERNGRRW